MAWTKKGHSPSSHPRHRITVRSSQRSVLLLELFAIVLCRRIHFLSVKTSHYFQVISEPLNLPSGQPGQFEQNTNLARGIPTGIATVTPLPPHHKLEGRPRTCTSSIFGTFQGEPPRPKRFNNRTGGPGSSQLSTLSGKPRSIFPNVQESPVAKKLTAKVSHMVTWQKNDAEESEGERDGSRPEGLDIQ